MKGFIYSAALTGLAIAAFGPIAGFVVFLACAFCVSCYTAGMAERERSGRS